MNYRTEEAGIFSTYHGMDLAVLFPVAKEKYHPPEAGRMTKTHNCSTCLQCIQGQLNRIADQLGW